VAAFRENGTSVYWNRAARDLIIANGSGNFRAHALIAIAAWLEVAKSRMNSRILTQSRSASFVVPTVPVLRR
jgi:hypothetical protein